MIVTLWLLSVALAADIDKGRDLAQTARCESCHTIDPSLPYGGGYAIETRFGIFYGTNLTPSPDGIGSWTAKDFARALKHGRSPRGKPYYPAFPYPSFTKMTDTDVADLFAYLQTVPAAAVENRAHELKGMYRGLWKMRLWKLVAFAPRDFKGDDRGEYLVSAIAHCGECHTGRGVLGKTRNSRYLAGNDDPPAPAPNITPGGIDWNEDDWLEFLSSGMTPDGDFAAGEMRRVIADGTAHLSESDRRAIAAYVMTVKARKSKGQSPEAPESEDDEPWM
jgi:mono/diheme cytochrome c family protein